VSRRMGVGVDAVWSIELEFELNSPSPDPAPPRGDASSERRREERPTVLDRVAARGSVWSVWPLAFTVSTS